jgi:hypothetical protein
MAKRSEKGENRSKGKFSYVGNAITGGSWSAHVTPKRRLKKTPKSDTVANFNDLKSLPEIFLGKAFGINDKDIENIEKRHRRDKLKRKIKETENIPPKVIKSSYPFKGKTPELDKKSFPFLFDDNKKKNGGKS